jgi:hypothetical protein
MIHQRLLQLLAQDDLADHRLEALVSRRARDGIPAPTRRGFSGIDRQKSVGMVSA